MSLSVLAICSVAVDLLGFQPRFQYFTFGLRKLDLCQDLLDLDLRMIMVTINLDFKDFLSKVLLTAASSV